MICKICNAEIPEGETKCPFCGTAVTMDVDPYNAPAGNAFPDPAGTFNEPTGSVSDPAGASSETIPSADDLGLSEPAQPYADPMANQNPNSQPQQPYMGNPGEIPNGTNVPPNFSQNSYDSVPPNFAQNNYNYGQDPSAELEKEAGTIQTLGIVALVLAIVIGFCCCAIAGPGVSIAALIKYNKIKDNLYLLSPDGQKKANLGKTLSIIAIVLGALAIVCNIILMASGFMEGFTEALEEME